MKSRHLRRNVKKFKKDTQGNIALMTGILISILFIGAGGTIDISRAYQYHARMQDVADTSALAAISGNTKLDMRRLAQESFELHILDDIDDLSVTDFKVRPVSNPTVRRATINVSADMDTDFLGIIGIKQIPISVSSMTEKRILPVEISLVLDVSASMRGQKLANLRDAATDFIEQVIGDQATSNTVSINIIPFGGGVNLGTNFAERLIPSLSTANLDPSNVDYTRAVMNNNVLATSRFRFTDGTNCVELDASDLDTKRIQQNSRSQIPSFIHGKTGFPTCPTDESSVIFNSNQKQKLIDKIQTMTLSHGTGMDIGALWGLKALSPSHRNIIGGDIASRPSGFNSNIMKVMVIMTDGNITGQGRSREPNNPDRLTATPSNPGSIRTYEAGTNPNSRGDATAIGRFNQVCDLAKANNIDVYTIGYSISSGSLAEDLLLDCAGDPNNFLLVGVNDVKAAFRSIAAALVEPRITR